jgi:hypothetical protein
MVPANRVDPSGWDGGEHGGQWSFEERHSMIEEILIGVIVIHRRTLT